MSLSYLNFFTERQRELIDGNKVIFGEDLRISILAEFNGNDWSKTSGRLFLHVDDSYSWAQQFGEPRPQGHNHYNYPTDLGYFMDVQTAFSLAYSYIWGKDDEAIT